MPAKNLAGRRNTAAEVAASARYRPSDRPQSQGLPVRRRSGPAGILVSALAAVAAPRHARQQVTAVAAALLDRPGRRRRQAARCLGQPRHPGKQHRRQADLQAQGRQVIQQDIGDPDVHYLDDPQQQGAGPQEQDQPEDAPLQQPHAAQGQQDPARLTQDPRDLLAESRRQRGQDYKVHRLQEDDDAGRTGKARDQPRRSAQQRGNHVRPDLLDRHFQEDRRRPGGDARRRLPTGEHDLKEFMGNGVDIPDQFDSQEDRDDRQASCQPGGQGRRRRCPAAQPARHQDLLKQARQCCLRRIAANSRLIDRRSEHSYSIPRLCGWQESAR